MSMRSTFLLQVRIPRDLIKALDHWCIDHDTNRRDLVERILRAWLERREDG
jgi:metal-responsive CopG/Arc/MetJ family transcriptional regulator